MEQFRLKNLDTKGQPNLCQQFSENILISSALLQIGFCQRCKLKNSENNLLNMAVCETFNLPLTDQFSKFFVGGLIIIHPKNNKRLNLQINLIVESAKQKQRVVNPYSQGFRKAGQKKKGFSQPMTWRTKMRVFKKKNQTPNN